MKKNILTIIIMAITLINTILTAVLIFVIVPTSNKTNQIVTKVASIVDLELESPDAEKEEISLSDMASYEIPDKLTINLKSNDKIERYAVLYVSLTMNTKHKDYETYKEKLAENENAIMEIVTEEFEKYTKDEIPLKKNEIREQVRIRIQDHFQSDFIINVSFGNLILS